MYRTTANELTGREAATAVYSMPTASDEVNHRLANQLQLIAALISAEERSIADPITLGVLERTRQRIVAVGAVHRHLYIRGHSDVDLGEYLEELGYQLARSCGRQRQIVVNAETVPVSGEIATFIGILVTELVTNACKHAYAAAEAGAIHVCLGRLTDGAYRLIVQDHGHGRSVDRAAGLGSRLIDATMGKLGAVATWEDAGPGTRFRTDVHF